MKIAEKKLIGVLFVLGVLSLVAGLFVLKNNKQKAEIENNNLDINRIKVAATIFPLYDIVRTVGGERIDANLILPPGASPHTFEITPSDVKNLQSTKIFFSVGHGIDDWTRDISGSVSDSEVFVVDENIELMSFEHQEDEHEGSEDPHYWLSPTNAATIAKNIAKKLGEIDPDGKVYYESRAKDFENELKSNEKVWYGKMSGLKQKDVVVFHDAWGYFSRDFGLNIAATFEPFPGKTPSPQYLAELEKIVKEKNVGAIFVEPQFSEESITTLANDLGVKVFVLDPIGGVSGRESYVDLISFNIDSVYNALK